MKKNSNPAIPIPKRPKGDTSDWVYLNDDLEQMYTTNQVKRMANMFNNNVNVFEIAKDFRADPDSIFMALFHLARRNKLTRSFTSELGICVFKEMGGSEHIAEKPKVG